MIRFATRLSPVAVALATGACFATRSDVKILQDDLATTRTAMLKADSARATQIAQVAATLGEVTDSIRSANAKLAKWQANVQGDLRGIQEQLLQVQELTGQSQNKLNDLRAQMEERVAQPAPSPVAPTPNDSTRSPGAAAGGPGPATLYKLSFDQMSRGAHSTARSGFESLLTQFPTSDLAPDAQYYIGETFQAEGNTAAADSVFNLVVSTYPRAPRAATALYKHGLFLQKAKRDREARQVFQSVIDKYPRSDEADLARERLRPGTD
jgi:tol-pal system protein YbgF